MRYKFKADPKIRDTKEKVKFLFLPTIINNEFRWLEFAKIKYEYTKQYTYENDTANPFYFWKPVEWLPYDPLYDCELYRKEGCIHVDGLLCDLENCKERIEFNKQN